MAHIALTLPHRATPERLHAAVQALAVDADLYGLFSRWKGEDRLVVEGKGLEAVVLLEPEALRAEVTLPWLFRLVRGVIASEVEQKLRQAIAAAEAEPA
jgi:putative polyhydroxyalkanoate system protein